MQTTQPEIVLVHRGGLGDFLTAWPSLFSLAAHFHGHDVHWMGSSSRLPWLEPFGVRSCSKSLHRGVEALFAREAWPGELRTARIYWFVLNALPPVGRHPGLCWLQGLRAGQPGLVRDSYTRRLLELGIPFKDQWLRVWRATFSRQAKTNAAVKTALLFPGAGHPAKQWPLVQFFKLSDWLARKGFAPCFVLGPAEVERGMNTGSFLTTRPASLSALQDILCTADLVVGNDSGPMHLAGMLGVPGVVLFGPADPLQWAPLGLRALSAKLPCSPCTQDGRIVCSQARCMQRLAQSAVRTAILQVLESMP